MAAALALQQRPQPSVGLAQLREQLRRHLPQRLWLAREFAEVMAVAHPPAAEALAGMAHPLRPEAERHLLHAQPGHDREPRPALRHRVPGALDAHQRAAADRDRLQPPCLERHFRQGAQRRLLAGEALPDPLRRQAVDLPLHLLRELMQRVAAGDRREHLQPHAPAPGLHAALVVPLAGAREAGLDAVVAGERREALAQGAARELHPPHRRCEVVVDRAPGHPAEVGEGPHVTVEEGELVLALIEPDEVPPRVHQPHQEEPGLAPLA